MDTLAKVKEFWSEGWSANQNWRNRAETAIKFTLGNQWSEEDLNLLKLQGRPALTINRILPVVNMIYGYMIQNRQDFKAYPVKGGTRDIAEVLTTLLKHTVDISFGVMPIVLMFLHGIVSGKGWCGLDIRYDDDPLTGDLILESVWPMDIIEDREHPDYDINRCKYIIRSRWEDKDRLCLQYPRKKAEISEGLSELASYEESTDVHVSEAGDYEVDPLETGIHDRRMTYRVKEVWYKEYRRCQFVCDKSTLEFFRVHPKKKQAAAALQMVDPNRWQVVERVAPVLMFAKTVGDVLLEEIEDPFYGITRYPFVRFCPYQFGDNIMGIVDNLIDPQREHNKRRSQVLHHLNSSANSGWFVEEGSLSPDQEEAMAEFGNRPGVILKYRKGTTPPQKMQPSPLSGGHLTLSDMSAADIRDISGASPNLQGQQEEPGESGKAIYYRQRSGLTILQPVYFNYNESLKMFGSMMLEFIRRGRGGQMSYLYSDEEIRAILDDSQSQIDLSQIRSLAVGRYGIVVDQAPSMPTERMAQFEQLLDAVKSGLQIDPIYLLQLSDLPNRDAIIQQIQAQRQAQQQEQALQQQVTAQATAVALKKGAVKKVPSMVAG